MSSSTSTDARSRFLALLHGAVEEARFVKMTLGKYRGADPTLRNLFIRPVTLKAGPHLTFVWRHATRDITKNHSHPEAIRLLEALIGSDFLDAHLFTQSEHAQLECSSDQTARLRIMKATEQKTTDAPETSNSYHAPSATAAVSHDRAKHHLFAADAPWLRALSVTNERGQVREGMAGKYRQIQKFAELLSHLLDEAFPGWSDATPESALTPNDGERRSLTAVDMGCGKGYLTFAVAALLGTRGRVRGVEARPELVAFTNSVASKLGFAPRLEFSAGTIADTPLDAVDVLIALHACDTATDDALARGIASGARLLVVSPCCQKELRPQLTAPAVLADALRHGIFQERQAEFVTDALRAQLLEWAGYRTKVFEFISTEHTAKNLMIAAIKSHPTGDATRAERTKEFAAFYGLRRQRLAELLHFPLR
jgi:SAM-dependent methyltransferase